MSDRPTHLISDASVKAEHVIVFHGREFPCKHDSAGKTFTIYTLNAHQSMILSQVLNEQKIYGFAVYTYPPASRFEFTDPDEVTQLAGLMKARESGQGTPRL